MAGMQKGRIGRVGFVSLGCPKALVDTERIVTELRAEGYIIAADYKEADLVIVNTCAFIDAAVAESLEAITEALRENGRVIVTGCLGGKKNQRRKLAYGSRAEGARHHGPRQPGRDACVAARASAASA